MMPLLFNSALSFEKLIAAASTIDESSDRNLQCLELTLRQDLAQVPEFTRPITDLGLLQRRPDILRRLMSLVFAPISGDSETTAAFIPFSDTVIYASPKFRDTFLDPSLKLRGSANIKIDGLARARSVTACLAILETFYGISRKISFPIVVDMTDPETGLKRYYNIHSDLTFVSVTAREAPAPLTEDQRTQVLLNLDKPERLMEIIPASNFEFQGFTILRAVDVTASEVMSGLERDLIDQQSLISREGFLRIQTRLRSLFRCPDLIAGISALQDDEVLLLNSGSEMLRHCIFQDSSHVPVSAFKDTPWEKAAVEKEIVLVPDIRKLPRFSHEKESLFPDPVRSLIIVPMLFEGDCIGTFSLGSPNPEEMSSLDVLKASQLQPLFAMAIKKALSDLNLHVQRIIKEKCTAIHPSVEWRFHKAAVNLLTAQRKGSASDIEPIVFNEVFSLFGISDIRGSSKARNQAIQEDLTRQLSLARAIVDAAGRNEGLLILRELGQQIDRLVNSLDTGLDTGAEINITGFLNQELEPLFPHLSSIGGEIRDAVDLYRHALDPDAHCVYDRRKAFEESFTRLNDVLSAHLREEEAAIQAAVPHYFEMHRTDGIDYVIYLGQSLLETGTFNTIFLKNLRLWQIRLAAGMARKSHELKSSLEVPLDTAHLILVQDAPLSIRFRYDEKRFDVDGAYDTRQEIIKSRLDKAVVKGTGERLTQPGKIAIVYARSSEAAEIRRHISFMINEGFLTDSLEELELEGILDVQGLKALRVDVNMTPS